MDVDRRRRKIFPLSLLIVCVPLTSCLMRPRPDPRAQILSERVVAFVAHMQAVQLRGKEFSDSLTQDQMQKAKEYAAFETNASKQAFLDSLTASQRSEYVDLVLMWQQLDARRKALAADISTYRQEVMQEKGAQQDKTSAAEKQANDFATLLMLNQLAQPPY